VLTSGLAEVHAKLTSTFLDFDEKLHGALQPGPRGRASVGAGLRQVLHGLNKIAKYCTREVIVLFSALGTCDRSGLQDITEQLREVHIRISVVSMSPELHALKQVCQKTGGIYSVALNPNHFKELMHRHLLGPPSTPNHIVPCLVQMAFPEEPVDREEHVACICHGVLHTRLYVCPRCESPVCQLPCRCPSCQLPLMSATILARGFRQLPPSAYARLETAASTAATTTTASTTPAPATAAGGTPACFACELPLLSSKSCKKPIRRCNECQHLFCAGCDHFVHNSLRQCPGCLAPDAAR